MLFMVTNRRKKGGEFSDEEMPKYGYTYLYEYLNGPQGKDGFGKEGESGFRKAMNAELYRLQKDGVKTPKVCLYVHGYNNDWQDSIDELVDLEKTLTQIVGYTPVLIGFSWPSTGKVKNYLSDREEVRDSVGAFTRFIMELHEYVQQNRQNCFSTFCCISHSMGNYLLRKGMEYLSDYLGTPVGRVLFNETIMLAPDLASKDIELDGKGKYITFFSRRVHVYYSRHDRALKASSVKRFGANRLGRHGADDYDNLSSNVVVINAEKYANSDSMNAQKIKDRAGKSISVHSSHRYHPAILADIQYVLSSVDRTVIPTRQIAPKAIESPVIEASHFVLT